MKNILIAPDGFKGSATSLEIAQAIEKGLEGTDFNIKIQEMADGGEGTGVVLARALNAKEMYVNTVNHYGDKIKAKYYIAGDTAIIESAEVIGLNLVPLRRRNLFKASTRGLARVLMHAVNQDVKRIIVGLGGSGTDDGGKGLLEGLGGIFLEHDFDLDLARMKFKNVELIVANDVVNPYAGPTGATYTYAKQKNAKDEDLAGLEERLVYLNNLFIEKYDIDLNKIPGTAAAGGLAGALYMLGGKLVSGIDLVMELTKFEEQVKWADVIITGEGKIDSQTLDGKVISGIKKMADKYNKEVIALGAIVEQELPGIKCYQVKPKEMSIEDSIENVSFLVQSKTKEIKDLL